MARPTVSDVYSLARTLLHDNGEAGGEVYTNTVLADFFGVAYRQLADIFAELRIGVFKRVQYFKLDAYQHRAELEDEGITLAAEPQMIREALIANEYTVNNVSNTLPLVFTVTPAPSAVATGDAVYVFNVGGQTAANGKWYVSGVSGNDIIVGGGDTSSAYTSGGSLVKILGSFTKMDPCPILGEEALATSNREYRFREGAIEVNPVAHAAGRLIEITYFESPNAPSSGTIPINGSLNFLAAHTAAMAEESMGNKEFADRLMARSRGHLQELLAHYGIRDYMPVDSVFSIAKEHAR